MPAIRKLSGAHYTQDEDAILRACVEDGVSDAEISDRMGRSVHSICTRRRTLDLYRKADKRRVVTNRSKSIESNQVASIWHLVDLKRAGHSPTRTELDIASNGLARAVVNGHELMSYVGSSAASCEAWS